MLILMISLLLNGCVHREILDDLNIETAKGYDLIDKDTIEGTALFPRYLSDKSTENVTLSAKDSSTRGVLGKLERRSQQPLVRGSLEVVLIGEKFAQRGVIDIADALQRDASIGSRVYLTIVKGNAKELLNGQYGRRGNAIFISNLLNHNIKFRDVPETNLHMFLFAHFQQGQTSFLPMIRQIDDENVEIAGIALFNEERVVAEIPDEQMFFFKLLVDKYSEGSHIVRLKNEKQSEDDIEVSITSLRSKHDIEVISYDFPAKVDININVKGIIREYTGEKLTPQKVAESEKKMKKDIEKKCNEMIKMFQEKKIDPIGIGQRQKHGIRGFDFKKWNAQYPEADIKVHAEVQIVESGTVE
jgi:spore germination protein